LCAHSSALCYFGTLLKLEISQSCSHSEDCDRLLKPFLGICFCVFSGFLTLSEKHRIRMFEMRALKKMYGPKREVVT